MGFTPRVGSIPSSGTSLRSRFSRRLSAGAGARSHAAQADLHAPWEMTPLEQQAAECVVGRDYPAPVVRHEEARRRTLAPSGKLKRTHLS